MKTFLKQGQRGGCRAQAENHAEAASLKAFFVDVLGGVRSPDYPPDYEPRGPIATKNGLTLVSTKGAENALFCPHVGAGGWDVFIKFYSASDLRKFFNVEQGQGLRSVTFKTQQEILNV